MASMMASNSPAVMTPASFKSNMFLMTGRTEAGTLSRLSRNRSSDS